MNVVMQSDRNPTITTADKQNRLAFVDTLRGLASYRCHIVHFAVLGVVAAAILKLPQPTSGFSSAMLFLTLFTLVVGITVGISSVAYKWVEIPSQSLGRRVPAYLEQR